MLMKTSSVSILALTSILVFASRYIAPQFGRYRMDQIGPILLESMRREREREEKALRWLISDYTHARNFPADIDVRMGQYLFVRAYLYPQGVSNVGKAYVSSYLQLEIVSCDTGTHSLEGDLHERSCTDFKVQLHTDVKGRN